jgi:hypothetical protein
MQNDKRTGEQAIPVNLREVLTPAQASTLEDILRLGWKLRFVRRPLFLEPVPVISDASDDRIGILDPDGKICLGTDISIRAGDDVSAGTQITVHDERRSGLAPVPRNLGEILNENQMTSLRQIENFGWQLHFVRRPLFQDPVVVIVSAEGDRFGTLEPDGRIEIKSRFDLRGSSGGR